MGFWKKLVESFTGKDKLSEPATLIGRVFEDESTIEHAFFDAVLARFENFDQFNQENGEKTFSHDVDFIVRCLKESLSSPEDMKKFPRRIDSYFYMYRRIEEYLDIIKKANYLTYALQTSVKQLKETILSQLSSAFTEAKGLQPNLCVRDKALCKRMGIVEHPSEMTKIDKHNVNLFLALCKLSFQSSILSNDYNPFQWKSILVKIKYFWLSLQEFISFYVAVELGFREFPLNMPTFIELVRSLTLAQSSDESPLFILIRLAQTLRLNVEEFFDQFRPLFETKVKDKQYKISHVADLLVRISRHDRIFNDYLSIYAASVDDSKLWTVFLDICEKGELSEKIQGHLVSRVADRISKISIENFLHYSKPIEKWVEKTASERRSSILKMYIAIFNAFIEKQLLDEQYSYRYYPANLKEFLEIIIKVSSTPAEALQQPSSLLIIQRLLFKNNERRASVGEQLKALFQTLAEFDAGLTENKDPVLVIDDRWLEIYLLAIPQDFVSRINAEVYRSLCENLRNNHWTIYIWNRLLQLSFLKAPQENTYGTLSKLNTWMHLVKHDVYDPADLLTISFVVNLFELILFKQTKSILSLPKIDSVMNFVLALKDCEIFDLKKKHVHEFIHNAHKAIQTVLRLQGKCPTYRDLLNPCIVDSFLPDLRLQPMFELANPQIYQFPITSPNLQALLPHAPADIDVTINDENVQFFAQFIEQVNRWLHWFDLVIPILLHVFNWLKTYNVEGAAQLYSDLRSARDSSNMTVLQMKTTVEKALLLLRPFTDLRRLCHLLNCLTAFQIIETGSINDKMKSTTFIPELKRSHPENSFIVKQKGMQQHTVPIPHRQNVQWSLACEKLPCHVSVAFNTIESPEDVKQLSGPDGLVIEKHVLQGEFETQRDGQLTITVNNEKGHSPRAIWFRTKQTSLSTCHLFHGIFNMFYQSAHQNSNRASKETEISNLLDKVFKFIDSLLDGTISLAKMSELKGVFCDKNIHVKEEVRKLFNNRPSLAASNTARTTTTTANNVPSEQEIEQVCEWLQIYQYYSYVNIVINCIETFEILPANQYDSAIVNLQQMSNENCSLRQITETLKFLHQRFQRLTSQHLQLIKIALECSAVVQMMKSADLYSNHGGRRFQELRDNLTTQFQLQERNNMILNSWIIVYSLCEPFVVKAKDLDDFIAHLAGLAHFEESALRHMQVVNDNIQLVNMWLSADETTVLDNALIMMEHLYRTGVIHMRLRRLMDEDSYFEIDYSINKIQASTTSSDEQPNQWDDDARVQRNEREKIKFTLSRSEIEDHKRQLTFCNVDLQENMVYKKILLTEQLKLLQLVENMFSTLVKLEMAGHPDYQLREESHEISYRIDELDRILGELKNDPHASVDRLNDVIRRRAKQLELIHRSLEVNYEMWITHLEKYRTECQLLKLFSNRQVMVLIILLSKSTAENSIKKRFLEKLSLSTDQIINQDKERQLAIQCLVHYLRSLRLQECDLSEDHVQQLYDRHQIENKSQADASLNKLSHFLRDLLNNGEELFKRHSSIEGNQQYLVTLTAKENTQERSSLEHDLNMDTCCILLNLFNRRLPAFFQILWCSTATEDDIGLFFSRIRTFKYLTFVLMDIDKMHHRLREIILNEQDALAQQTGDHGLVYYFSRELTYRKGLRPFVITARHRNATATHKHLNDLIRKTQLIPPQIQIICGTAGSGKTHRINTTYKNEETLCISVNDRLHLSTLINSFLTFGSTNVNNNASVYFNISIHAPFEQLNRTLFSLLVCGSLIDTSSGLTFSLPSNVQWRFLVEIPHTDKYHKNIRENFEQILPLMSLVSSSNLDEVTEHNYQLYIGEEEELVARFLKAYADRTIDRRLTQTRDGVEHPVDFAKLTDPNESRRHIHDCLTQFAPELPRNKISELSFTKFLYRRVRFFTQAYYRFNMTIEHLGSTAMKQMINEAKSLSRIDFRDNDYPRVYLVYDPNFSLHLLHDSWVDLPEDLKQLFRQQNPSMGPEFQGKNYFAKCLSWLMDIQYDDFIRIMNDVKFILTENFTYKLFHVHERKLTKLALIIEGHTGVGKTFLLNFYSLLLNANVAHGSLHDNVAPRIRERTGLWLLNTVISEILEKEPNLLNAILRQIKPKLMGLDDNGNDQQLATIMYPDNMVAFGNAGSEDEDDDEEDPFGHNPLNMSLMNLQPQALMPTTLNPAAQPVAAELAEGQLLKDIKQALLNHEYDNDVLQLIWKAIVTVSHEQALNVNLELITAVHDYVTTQLTTLPLIEASVQLQKLLANDSSSMPVRASIQLFNEYLLHTHIKPLFYRLLLHPGVTEEKLEEFMTPICQLAEQLVDVELVIFFDEVNTSSCLGLFKEMFMDRTMHGRSLPKNIFFTAAINPAMQVTDEKAVHRQDYLVHQLPQSLEHLKVSYGVLEAGSLRDYIEKKIVTVRATSTQQSSHSERQIEKAIREMLTDSIINAQAFCEQYLGENSVSQREIQRCFNLIEFFRTMRFDGETTNTDQVYQPDSKRCIALALALIYYFRLPTEEDNAQRKDEKTPTRERLARVLSRTIPDFVDIIQTELENFVNNENFVIPQGVAINQAIREHIFSIVVSVVTRTPLCIIGAPGQSKTLSFQIVLQNLQGSQLSTKAFCKRLPAIDPFFCLGSKYSRSEDIAYIFDRAIKREQHYEQNRISTRCVVFLDEASLPDENKMVLKVLHPYLDECKVAFVAVANKSFDAANANRMICIYRSLPSEDDQKTLAYGCLGLRIDDQRQAVNTRLENIIYGLCQGYRRILQTKTIPSIYHDRDFIYMLRELRFELTATTDEQDTHIDGITPISLLRALEDNFNGISNTQFVQLVEIFFKAVQEKCADFKLPTVPRRNVPTILCESMKLDSVGRRLYGRYKLIVDESEDESAVRLLTQCGVLDLDPAKTTVFRMSDFPDDVHDELRNVEILSTIKLCMETGKTILMVNTGRIHGSLYDVFNQNFSIMATGDNRKIWSKVAIGPKTIDVVVHEDFQCIVHIKRSEFDSIPAPFLSRFQKYSLSVNDFYQIQLQQLSDAEQLLMNNVEQKAQTFLQHFSRDYLYGLNENTLYSCLLSFIKHNETEDRFFLDVHQQYTQLTIKSKAFIEQNPGDVQQCLLRSILSKLMQLAPPETIILKLPTFDDKIARWICTNYFHHQEHFSMENFIQKFISNSTFHLDQNDLFALDQTTDEKPRPHARLARKVMIFTRTSSCVIGLNQQSKKELFTSSDNDEFNDSDEKVDILNLAVIEKSTELEERFRLFEVHKKTSLFIVVVNARTVQQRLHIPYVRQLIDNTEYRCNTVSKQFEKYFLLLVHAPAQTIYHQSSFPSIFLHDWDFYFFDTCMSGNVFHLQKMLQILTSSYDQHAQEPMDDMLCDLNSLFDDCLWDFCSRIQIFLQDLPKDMFSNAAAHEFYQRQTGTIRRVQCLKQILQQSTQLQKRIVNIYHTHLSTKKDSSKKIYTLIYQISKDILCGKRFDGLVDSIQSQTRMSFTNFVANIFKYVVNDYGLDTLPKLSNTRDGYDSMLNLIDYSSFSSDNDHQLLSSSTQGVFQLVTHYACIPQTPLYHLFHQRIKSCADEIKLRLIHRKAEPANKPETLNLREGYYDLPTTTTTAELDDDHEMNEYTLEEFRFELIKSITQDKVLTDSITEHILTTYSTDLVQTFCTIVEKNFDADVTQFQKTIEFVSRWLRLIDENDRRALHDSSHRHIWLLAHVYTSFEYDQNDLFSLYSACRITDRLDPTRSFYEELFRGEGVTRTNVRERLFRTMFDYLWKNLCELSRNQASDETWILTYTLISKYYPSDKVLEQSQLVDIKARIEFMNLAYLIFLNEKTPSPKELVSHMLQHVYPEHEQNADQHAMNDKSIYPQRLPKIIDCVHRYFEAKNTDHSTLMVDLLQWIVAILRSSPKAYREEIISLWKYLNEPTCQLTWPMKQFLFDELANLYLETLRQNRGQQNRSEKDIWDRVILLLPMLIECAWNEQSLPKYQVPFHPSVIIGDDQRSTLLDLFFFYLKRSIVNETIHGELVNKIIQSMAPSSTIRNQTSTSVAIFKQLKSYFLVHLTGLLVCQPDASPDDQDTTQRILSTTIDAYLPIEGQPVELSQPLQIFLSTIISKRSWNFLLGFLKSEHVQQYHQSWSTTLYRLLELRETGQVSRSLQLWHRLQFTLSANTVSSIFPALHQPYQELRDIVDQCAKKPADEQRWKDLSDWIALQGQANPTARLDLTQIKVMLLLNIYYEYYCSQRLAVVKSLLTLIESTLQPLPEEMLVFRALIQPEESMIGYPRANDNEERNSLNTLFALDCQDEDELPIRHGLVNLMAMILMGGKQSFLWTFAFQPLALQNTFGFGSTAQRIIQTNGVHYDCGCIITVNGDLLQFAGGPAPSGLNVPAVYIAFFATFGAMAWHLLLFDNSVQNLHGPILAPHAIADNTNDGRIAGNSLRTKVCHFVRARLLSTFHFLSVRSNQDDACLLMNRCFEQLAFVTIHHQQPENVWMKPTFATLNEETKAEKEFQDRIFYAVFQKLAEHKAYVNQLNLQSQIQTNLQSYVSQLPMLIQYLHFKTELHNPIYAGSSLKILQRVLDSSDFLALMKSIYDLSQFYLLLHQTYSLLIEQDEFLQVTLAELYRRGQEHYNNADHLLEGNRNNNHLSTIENGIKAVNGYHAFTDGLIRPGACDETQRFKVITMETPIHYLVTTENHDEGDIVMRILSVLVDYHNSLSHLLEQELNSDENRSASALKDVVNKLILKEVSILQIARDNTGVITLSKNDHAEIEQLARTSLISDEDGCFQTAETPLRFDFVHVQSYVIRTYLLLCRINYRHIAQKYQWRLRRAPTTTDIDSVDLDERYSKVLSVEQLETEWGHLKQMPLDKLYHGHKLLRQIALMISAIDEDLSGMMLAEFLENVDDDATIRAQVDQYELKEFRLCHISPIREIYGHSISDFQHLFTDVPRLLRTPIEADLNDKLTDMLQTNLLNNEQNEDMEKLKSVIQTITDLLNDLRAMEDTLLAQSARSLPETCALMTIENPILSLIPVSIKCENYVSFSIHLIRARAILQEKVMNIEEKETTLWEENFDEKKDESKLDNRFHQYLNPQEPVQEQDKRHNILGDDDWGLPATSTDGTGFNSAENGLLDEDDFPRRRAMHTTQQSTYDERPEYSSLFELHLKFVLLSSSPLSDRLLQARLASAASTEVITKAQKFTVTLLNGTLEPNLWKREKLFDQLTKLFTTKKYSLDTLVVVDNNQIFVDFTNSNARPTRDSILDYSIIPKTSLFQVHFHFGTDLVKYSTTSKASLFHVILRFLDEHHAASGSANTFLCFFDRYGKIINEETVGELYQANDHENNTIDITVSETRNDSNTLCEVILRPKEGAEQTTLFYWSTQWRQIDFWLRRIPTMHDLSARGFAYFVKEQNNIVDHEEPISLSLEQFKSVTVDGISQDETVKVTFSYETNSQSICALKTVRISHLLNNERLLRPLNLVDISPNDCVLVLGEHNGPILSSEDIRKPVGDYATAVEQSIHFRISLLIQILNASDPQQQQIPLANARITAEELLRMALGPTDVYTYLASNYTKRILDPSEKLCDLNETKFLLVKEQETCLVLIKKVKNTALVDIDDDVDNTIQKRFTIFATLDDVSKANKIDSGRQLLLHAGDFVPSKETQLACFQSTSPIVFTLVEDKPPISILVENNIDGKVAKFCCALTMTVQRLTSIVCQLLDFNSHFCQLMYNGCIMSDDDLCLEDFVDSAAVEVEFQLASSAPVKSSIIYGEQTIVLPCTHETLASTLVEEALKKLHIPLQDMTLYTLTAITDNDHTKIDLDLSVEDIYQLFPLAPPTIPLELRKTME